MKKEFIEEHFWQEYGSGNEAACISALFLLIYMHLLPRGARVDVRKNAAAQAYARWLHSCWEN